MMKNKDDIAQIVVSGEGKAIFTQMYNKDPIVLYSIYREYFIVTPKIGCTMYVREIPKYLHDINGMC